MNTAKSALPLALAAIVTVACAAHPDPIVDMKGVDPEALAQDWEECEVYTEEVQMSEGDVGESVATGGLYGGTRSALDADEDKQAIFKRCLRGRGYRVLN